MLERAFRRRRTPVPSPYRANRTKTTTAPLSSDVAPRRATEKSSSACGILCAGWTVWPRLQAHLPSSGRPSPPVHTLVADSVTSLLTNAPTRNHREACPLYPDPDTRPDPVRAEIGGRSDKVGMGGEEMTQKSLDQQVIGGPT